SADLIDRLRAQDPRVVHVRHEQNCGLPGLRVNEGIELARGEYLAFQFDDDCWRPNALKTLVRAVQQAEQPSVVVGKAFFTTTTGPATLPAVELNLVSLYEQNRLANNSVLVPRELVSQYGMYDCHIAMRRLTDWDLWLRYVKHVPFVVVDEVISDVYESNPGSIGLTVPWDLSLFRYLHDIPRNPLLTPAAWRDYQVDALSVGGMDVAKDFRRRIYEEHLVPYYLRFRASFPQIEGFRASLPCPAKTALYTKNSYDVSNDVTLNNFDVLANERGSYKSHFQVLDQVGPGWQKEADALLLVRVVEEEGKTLARQAIADGIPVGFYLDDDLLTFHEFGPQFDYLAPGTPYYQNLTELLGRADAVWTTNRFIAESVLPHNPRTIPHTNCVPHDWLPAAVRRRDAARPLRVGYAGSGYRREEFTLIWEALRRLSRKYGDRLAFEFWGIDVSTLPPLASPTTQRPFTFSYFSYLERLRGAQFDVLLTPLLERPRPRLGKSLIKYFETAVAGALGIFSDVPQYAALPHGQTCLKAANSAEAWYAALEEAVTMPAQDFDRLRRGCLLQVREEYTNAALIDRHEAAWRATEFHARTRGQRHADGRPRVLYVLHSANFGGGELQLWRRLRAIREYGIEPIVVLPKVLLNTPEVVRLSEGLARERLQLEFVDYTCFNEPRSPSEFCSEYERPQVRELLTRCSPALIHTVTFNPTFGQICQEMGVPHVASLYGIDDAFRWAQGAPGFVHCTLNQSDSIRYARRWAELLGTEWVCAREVVPEACFRLGFERSLRPVEGARDSAYAGPIRLMVAGTVQPHKRQAEAIEAVSRLRREGIDCRLALYGSTHFFPDYYQHCLDLIKKFALQDRVVFHGFTGEIAEVLAQADVLLCPSVFESFPSAIKEAMAAGVLAVAAPVGGIPELIVDQRSGILCADTSVEALVEGVRRAAALTGEDYRRIVEAARRIARVELHPQRAVNDLLGVYLRTLELHAAASSHAVDAVPRTTGVVVEVNGGMLNGAGGEPGGTLPPTRPQSADGTRPAGAVSADATAGGELTESVGIPPVGYISLSGPLRYRLTPRLPRW
ncbi:MAG TPA: glycosyltransferase, partial [Candidatus Binatia bacterium]|nr:glycosyltransferase [Candidatus Binatia bacterium]